MPKFTLVPREGKFFKLFKQSAENAEAVALGLKEMLNNWNNLEGRAQSIIELEHRGDAFTHEVIALVHRTFVTPFDREDIALLAHSLDDIVDFIESATDAMSLYKIDTPTEKAKEMSNIIHQTTIEVHKAVSELEERVNLKRILSHCVEINRLENVGDKIYRQALAELFKGNNDIPYIIKWREIYEYMETAIDRCEDVANVLEGVVLKYA
jgi:predicted phosphate transport protein (TIGR00153 family)